VLNCTAGWSTLISDMAGVPLPITTHILQACVTEPMKPLHGRRHRLVRRCMSTSARPTGANSDGRGDRALDHIRMQGTLNFLQDVCRHAMELFPQLERARLLRSWAGLCDLSPDYSPILGKTEVRELPRERRAGGPTASRPPRSSARRSPSSSPPAASRI